MDNKLTRRELLYVTLGALGITKGIDVTSKTLGKLIEIIKNTNPSGFLYEYKVYPEFGHCPEPSLVDGLKWLKKAVSPDVE